MKARFIKLTFLSLVALCACDNLQEQDFFGPSLSTVKFGKTQDLSFSESYETGAFLPMSYIVDSMVVSLDRNGQEYMYSLSSFPGDKLLGTYCRKGRSSKEVLNCLPVMDTYDNQNGELCSDLFSYGDGRIFSWNISRSRQMGTDVYDRIVQLRNDEDYFPVLSCYHLDSTHVIVRNSRQRAAVEELVEVPCYEIYSMESGARETDYELFKMNPVKTKDIVYSAKSFYASTDCINPDRTKIAFGMGYMPVYGILDLASGDYACFRVKGFRKFSKKDRIWHFCSMVSDDHYIYALYYGGNISNPNAKRKESTLLVMDWDGVPVSSFSLEEYVTELKMSDGILYFTGRDNVIYSIDTDDLSY